jgi:aminoglycoside phosphotransferase (APT) family kinase protein
MRLDLEDIVREALGTERFAITYRQPAPYQSNDLYDVLADGQRFIAKVFLNRKSAADDAMRELAGLRHAAAISVAPQPLLHRPGQQPVIVYRFLEGLPWPRRAPDPMHLQSLVLLTARIGALDVAGLPTVQETPQSLMNNAARWLQRYLHWSEAHAPAAHALREMINRALALGHAASEELARMAFPPRFIKLDAQFVNVLSLSEGGIGLVDWEDSGVGDLALGLAGLITHPYQEDLLDWSAWRRALAWLTHEPHAADLQLHQRIAHYCRLLALHWLAILVDRSQRQVENGRPALDEHFGLPRERRLRRYLARALANSLDDLDHTLSELTSEHFFVAS